MPIRKNGELKDLVTKGESFVKKIYRGDEIVYDIFNYEVFDQVAPVISDIETGVDTITFKLTNKNGQVSVIRYDVNQDPNLNSLGVLLHPDITSGTKSYTSLNPNTTYNITARGDVMGQLGPIASQNATTFSTLAPEITQIEGAHTSIVFSVRNPTNGQWNIHYKIGGEPNSSDPYITLNGRATGFRAILGLPASSSGTLFCKIIHGNLSGNTASLGYSTGGTQNISNTMYGADGWGTTLFRFAPSTGNSLVQSNRTYGNISSTTVDLNYVYVANTDRYLSILNRLNLEEVRVNAYRGGSGWVRGLMVIPEDNTILLSGDRLEKISLETFQRVGRSSTTVTQSWDEVPGTDLLVGKASHSLRLINKYTLQMNGTGDNDRALGGNNHSGEGCYCYDTERVYTVYSHASKDGQDGFLIVRHNIDVNNMTTGVLQSIFYPKQGGEYYRGFVMRPGVNNSLWIGSASGPWPNEVAHIRRFVVGGTGDSTVSNPPTLTLQGEYNQGYNQYDMIATPNEIVVRGAHMHRRVSYNSTPSLLSTSTTADAASSPPSFRMVVPKPNGINTFLGGRTR